MNPDTDIVARQKLPVPLKKILLKIALLVGGWLICYNFLLKPAGIPDRHFTAAVIYGTEKALSLFFDNISTAQNSVYINDVRAIKVADACNGLELVALFAGIIIAMPGSIKRKSAFILLGGTGIIALNIIRCTLLAWMYHEQMPLADFAHHYAFKLIIYVFTFICWVAYSKKVKFYES